MFSETRIVEIHLQFYQENFWELLLDTRHTENFLECDITIDGTLLPSVGARIKGQSSFQIPSNKKSLKIDLNEFVDGQKYDGLKKFNLNNGFSDPTLLREKLMYDKCAAIGLPAPRANFAKVFINDVYWGLYILVDQVDDTFLDRVFEESGGNLYKGDPSGDLVYYGEDILAYKPLYQLHNINAEDTWYDLLNLISAINLSSDTEYEAAVNSLFEMEDFYTYWALLNYTSSLDSYIGSAHNYYLYHKGSNDKFNIIAWDANESFGGFNYNELYGFWQATLPFDYLPLSPEYRPIVERSLTNTYMRKAYHDKLYEVSHMLFDTVAFNTLIDSYADMIRTAVYADSLKMYPDSEFETNLNSNIISELMIGGRRIPGLKQLMQEKWEALNTYFVSIGFEPYDTIPGYTEITDIANASIQLQPNPTSGFLQMQLPATISDEIEIAVYTIAGTTCPVNLQKMGSDIILDCSPLPAGMYVIKVRSGNGLYTSAFIKR